MIREAPLKKLAKELAIEQEKIHMEQLEQLANEKKKYQEKAKEILKDCIKEFMKENPEVKALGWVQYTPYFNDGDECVFSIHGIGFSLKEVTAEQVEETSYFDGEGSWISGGGTYDRRWLAKYDNDGLTKELYDKISKVIKQLYQLKEELRIVFGDHVKVVVTQDGVETYEYEHE